MKKLSTILKDFFKTQELKYKIKVPKHEVLLKIGQLLQNKSGLPSDHDFSGHFLNQEAFKLNLSSAAYSNPPIRLSPTLIGTIQELNSNETIIKTTIKKSLGLFLLFFISLILGVISLIILFNTTDVKFIGWPFLFLLGGPFFSVWYSNVSSTAIIERFQTFINKSFKP